MAKGKEKSQWEQTSLLAAIIANPNRDPDKHPEPYSPLDFNPFANVGDKAKRKPPTKKKYSMEQVRGLIESSMTQQPKR